MEVEIRLFATLKDRAQSERIRISLPANPTTVRTLLAAVGDAYPALSAALPTSLVAVNRAYAGPDTVVHAGDEVALFPPVSGGSELPHPAYFAVSPEPLDIIAVQSRLVGPEIGAVVSFTGFVRGQTRRDGLPTETLHLDYEAYESMAEEKMAQIAHEIWTRWPTVRGVALVQRTGRLEVGEVTTFVACAGGHRDQGVFEAARYGIDRLKEIVPVWKKEVGSDRSVWIEGHYRPTIDDNL
ncbi:MAG: molybdenum cofactor biosynthesis protein MoaE [Chloroflexota bacterium]|jgi:MoaE-MoaD fusion protein